MEKAIEKINAEMQKDPTNTNLEIIGQYIIDRCVKSGEVVSAVNGGKTLSGAMDALSAEARKRAKGNCAMLRDSDIFDIVDKYLSAPADEQVREATKRAVDGDAPAVKKAPSLDLDFESLI